MHVRKQATGCLLPVLGGVELLHASFTSHRYSRHFHERYALGCIEQGAMRFRYRGEGLVAAAGQVNLVVPGEAHDGHAFGPEGWRYRMFYLRPEALAAGAHHLGAGTALPHFRPGVIDDPALAAQVRTTHVLCLNPSVAILEKETRLLLLLARWISAHADERGRWPELRSEHGAARTARDYMADHYYEDVSLADLSHRAGLSSFHLVRVFCKQYGVTPHEYLTQTRISRARDRIMEGARLADAAADVGLADQSHLTRLFKRQVGLTPGAYRKILQNSG